MPKNTYLFLSIIGFILPVYFIYQIALEQNGFDFGRFFSDISVNPSSRLIAADLAVAATTFVAFLFYETRRLKIKFWWISIIGTFLVGASFGFPFFMYLREITIESAENKL